MNYHAKGVVTSNLEAISLMVRNICKTLLYKEMVLSEAIDMGDVNALFHLLKKFGQG